MKKVLAYCLTKRETSREFCSAASGTNQLQLYLHTPRLQAKNDEISPLNLSSAERFFFIYNACSTCCATSLPENPMAKPWLRFFPGCLPGWRWIRHLWIANYGGASRALDAAGE